MTEPDRRAEGATIASPGFSGTEALQDQDPVALEADSPTTPMTVNLGPSHPAMHGTVRLTVTLDGETIVEAIPEIGFLHRGFSKSSENSTWHQVLPYTDRLNYVSPILNNTGYIMAVDEAIDWGFTGPCLRACGVNYDVRKAHPYSVYDRMDFEIPLGSRGDTYDRYVLRIEEIRQSHRIVLQCLEQMPPGPIIIDDWRYALPPKKDVFGSIEGVMAHFKLIMEGIPVPAGEVYVYTEGANGELGFHIVSNGKGKPYAIQVRGPGLPILSALPRLIKGHAVADLIPIFDSINMIGGEVEQ